MSRLKCRRVWVVEAFLLGEWMPTVGMALTRAACVPKLREFAERNPDDRFRIASYVSKP